MTTNDKPKPAPVDEHVILWTDDCPEPESDGVHVAEDSPYCIWCGADNPNPPPWEVKACSPAT